MFDPGQHVMYTRTTGVQAVATIMGPSPSGDQFRHLQCVQRVGSRPVDNFHAPLLRMEPVRVRTPSPMGTDSKTTPEETLRQVNLYRVGGLGFDPVYSDSISSMYGTFQWGRGGYGPPSPPRDYQRPK